MAAFDDFMQQVLGTVSPQAQAQIATAAPNTPTLQPQPQAPASPPMSITQTPDDPSDPSHPFSTLPHPAVAGVVAAQDPDAPSFRSQVRGPFGSHGVLADILGNILEPNHYNARVQYAKEADIVKDFASDPQGTMLRLTALEGIPAAQQFQSNNATIGHVNAETGQLQQATALSQATMPAVVADKQAQAANVARNILGSAKDASTYPAAYNLAARYLAPLHMTPEDLGAPTTYDADKLAMVVRGGMTGKEQSDADYHQARIGQIDADQSFNHGFKQQQLALQGRNIDSEIQTRAGNLGVARTNAATSQTNAQTNRARVGVAAGAAATQARNVDSEIADRLWRQQHPGAAGVAVANERAKLKGAGGAALATPPYDPAKFKGHVVPDPHGGKPWISDGVKWHQ